MLSDEERKALDENVCSNCGFPFDAHDQDHLATVCFPDKITRQEKSIQELEDWNAGAKTCIAGLENRIKEIENQFTEYAHDATIKRDALAAHLRELEGKLCGAKEALKGAAWLYDQMAMGPLEAAAKYGPDHEPITDEQCLEIRSEMEAALSSTAPCPHAARAEKAEGEVKRLREAGLIFCAAHEAYWDRPSGFALENLMARYKEFNDELRRRAEKEG